MKIKKMTLTIKICLAVLLFSIYYHQHAIEISKSMELDFETETSFFVVDNSLAVWDSANLELSIFKDKLLVKKLKLNKGEGPQDFRVMSNIISTKKHFIIWDHILRRYSFYSKDWKFEKIKKIATLGFFHPLAVVDDSHYLAMWNNFEKHKKGSTIYQNVGIVDDNKVIKVLHKIGGPFNEKGILNYDRPHLIVSLSANKLYFAGNQEYKVYMAPLKKNKILFKEAKKCIERKYIPCKWDSQCTNLQWIVSRKPQRPQKIKYPENIPPIFAIVSSDELTGVVTNELILQEKTKIDFFKNNQYVGSCKIPILYMQYYVFPSWLYFTPGIVLNGNTLYTYHYLKNEEIYKIIKWKIKI